MFAAGLITGCVTSAGSGCFGLIEIKCFADEFL